MKARNVSVRLVLIISLLEVVLIGCKREPIVFSMESMVAGPIDLNVTASPPAVPVNPVIVATFNTDVDPATAVADNFSLIQDYDQSVIALTITASGRSITIEPAEDLSGGTLYLLTLKAGVKSVGGLALIEISRYFTTLGTFVPNGAIAYWNFEDNANDQSGTFNPTANGVVDIIYSASRNEAAGKAATFNGTTSIIEIPNGDVLMNSPDFTLSFWVKTNSTGHINADGKSAGYFVLGLGTFYGLEFEISANFSSCKFVASYEVIGKSALSEDLWFQGDGKDKDHNGWQGWEFCKDLTGSGGVPGLLKDRWAHVVCMYEASTRRGTLYINGEKMKVLNFNLWPDGNDRQNISGLKYRGQVPETFNELAFGFIQSRSGVFYNDDPRYGYGFPTSDHFKGQLDDIRIFHKALTEIEIQLMYNTEK